MKFVWIFITLMALVGLAPAAVKAQEPIKATTFDGKHVLLYADGSWKPVITDPGSAAHLGAFAEPQQVTLYSRRKYDNYMKATFSFKYGIRDDPGLRITRNLWDCCSIMGTEASWCPSGRKNEAGSWTSGR